MALKWTLIVPEMHLNYALNRPNIPSIYNVVNLSIRAYPASNFAGHGSAALP